MLIFFIYRQVEGEGFLKEGGQTMPAHYATINIMGINIPHQENPMATTRNAILALLSFILPVLLQLIVLKFHNESITVFEAHPITTKVAIAALLLFALSFGIDFTFHSSSAPPPLLRTTLVFSGSLLLASLASILFPDEWRPLIYVIYVLLSLGNYLYRLVRKGREWVQQGMMKKWPWHIRRGPTTLPLYKMKDMRYRFHIVTSTSTASIISCS